jgi:hypothetical protein
MIVARTPIKLVPLHLWTVIIKKKKKKKAKTMFRFASKRLFSVQPIRGMLNKAGKHFLHSMNQLIHHRLISQ